MAQVTFDNAGAGSGVATTTQAVAYPTNISANDLIILQATIRDTTSTMGAPTGFSALYGPDAGSTNVRQYLWYKLAAGTESGNLTVTSGGSVCKCMRMYLFKNQVQSASFYESGGVTSGSNSGSGMSPTAVTPGDVDALAVCFLAMADDNAVGDVTGETTGNWAEAVAEFTTTEGTDGCIQLQTANVTPSAAVSGGSVSVGNDNWVIRTFAIKSASPTAAPTPSVSDSQTSVETLSGTVSAVLASVVSNSDATEAITAAPIIVLSVVSESNATEAITAEKIYPPQFARPSSDGATLDWTSSASSHYTEIDEEELDTNDYITGAGNAGQDIVDIINLSALADPTVHSGHRISINGASGENGDGGCVIYLRQSTTVIATWSLNLGNDFSGDAYYDLTSGEAASITDYSALNVRCVIPQGVPAQGTFTTIYQLAFQTPGLPAPEPFVIDYSFWGEAENWSEEVTGRVSTVKGEVSSEPLTEESVVLQISACLASVIDTATTQESRLIGKIWEVRDLNGLRVGYFDRDQYGGAVMTDTDGYCWLRVAFSINFEDWNESYQEASSEALETLEAADQALETAVKDFASAAVIDLIWYTPHSI